MNNLNALEFVKHALTNTGYSDHYFLDARFIEANLDHNTLVFEVDYEGEQGTESGNVFVSLVNGKWQGDF